MTSLERTVESVDLTARDGLQTIAVVLPTGRKGDLVRRLIAAGSRRAEIL